MTIQERLKQHYGKAGKRRVDRVITTCEQLLHYYEEPDDKSFSDSCPLCNVKGFYCSGMVSEEDRMFSCPWTVFTGYQCGDYKNEKIDSTFGMEWLRAGKKENWLKIRIPMLKRWIKHLKTFRESI